MNENIRKSESPVKSEKETLIYLFYTINTGDGT
jgi:hypothetical protein